MKPPNKLERQIIASRVNFFLRKDSATRKQYINYPDAVDETRYYEIYMLYIDIIGLSNEAPE